MLRWRTHTTEDFALDVLNAALPLDKPSLGIPHTLRPDEDGQTVPLLVSSGQSFTFKIFAASESASFSVSSFPTAAKTRMPRPIDEMSCWSTVTEADVTLCRMAERLH